MISYGFKKIGDTYTWERLFLNGDFKAILSFSSNGQIKGKVIDRMTGDEYDKLRQKQTCGSYVNTVRSAYEALLAEVSAACCDNILFSSPQANRLSEDILTHFQVSPDFPWEHDAAYQSCGVFRHPSNKKWFALIMNVKRKVLDKNDDSAMVDILNVKIPPSRGEALHQLPFVYPAYHMNHRTWISIVLDDTLSNKEVLSLVESSYELTK